MPAQLTRSTRSRTFVTVLVAFLLAGTLLARGGLSPSPALAQDCPPGQVPVIIGGQIFCVPDGGLTNDVAPDRLLNRSQLNSRMFAATAEQKAALLALEEEAITNAMNNHQIPAGERSAVQTWGRADAQAELWALLVKAAKTPTCAQGQTTDCRTANQQHAVDWMSYTARQQGIEVAKAAGRELAVYMGVSVAGYEALFADPANPPSKATLTQYLDVTPVNFNHTDKNQATGGYCVYRSPAPYGSEYTGYLDQTCFTPCTNVLGCDDPIPSAEQFIKWGAARWMSSTDSTELADASRQIALAIGAGVIAGGVIGGIAIGATLGFAFAGTAFAATVFPFAATAVTATAASWSGATLVTATGTTVASSMSAGAVAAAGAGAIFAAVLLFIVGTTLRLISLIQDAEVPAKVAEAIVDARTATYDPAAMIGNAEDEATLWRLFVGATLPAVRYETCNNYHLVNSAVTANALCLNAPAIPSASASDPSFVITTHATPTSPASSTTISPTLTFRSLSPLGLYDTTTRVHGNWFVHNISGFQVQSLRIRYADWELRHHTAWLFKTETGAYRFVGISDPSCAEGTICQPPALNIDTCEAAGECLVSSTIKFVAPDGTLHTAQLGTPTAVTWSSPAAITYGTALSAAQLNATVAGTAGSFAYTVNGQPFSAADNLVLPAGSHTLGVIFTPTDSTLLPGSASVALTVNKAALTVKPTNAEMVYGASVPTINPGYTGFVNSDNATAITTPPTCSTSATSASVVGFYATSCSGGVAANYTFSFQDGSLEVKPRNLTVTASNRTKTYGQTVTFAGTEFTTSGLVNADSVTSVSLSSDGAAEAASTGPYPILPSLAVGTGLTNYTIQYADGTLEVQAAPLLITASSGSTVLGGTVPVIEPIYEGFVAGDGAEQLTTAPECSTTATSASPVGSYVTSCSGAAGANYTISYAQGQLDVTHGVAVLFSQVVPAKKGSTIPIKLQIRDAEGNNLSTAGIAVVLASPSVTPAPGTATQPSGSFVFVEFAKSGPMYQYDLKTKGYPSGSYTLSFTVEGDPSVHSVSFVIR